MFAARLRLLAPALAACVLWAAAAHAQSTEDDLRTRFVGHTPFLRDGWVEDKLKFNAAGQPEKPYKTGPPTVCGFRADKVELSGDHLRLSGVRVGVTFSGQSENFVVIPEGARSHAPEKITIDIDGHGQTDFTEALKAIFVPEWKNVAKVDLPSPGKLLPRCPDSPAAASAGTETQSASVPCAPGLAHVGGSIRPPKLLHSKDPDFNDWARRLKYSGNVEVYLVVDEQGLPARVRVVRPAGLGLDEQAIASVNQYRFSPATQNGHPVQVDLYVEVNFQIF